MKAADLIRNVLNMNEVHLAIIADMRETPLVQPTSLGGNHPLWVIGHLAIVEEIFRSMITGESTTLNQWHELFGATTVPSSDASKYPEFDTLMDEYKKQRALNLAMLDGLAESDLEQPLQSPPPGMTEEMIAQFFPNAATTLLVMTNHFAFHCGQVADARRALGKAPLMF
ncbi:DinB family protein [Rhodopirellula sp. MGV]|uniref:DinB family protein n=1 Tax=Rhodopirellula sp. MGV TaxID=2023130 RepID=UPI000B974F6C|nr:DinB family protein [Rhodopirellula sp. MGV]OYP38814.1 hypothetical protein CGZ80_00900 [Rhodopirellula sp. MGV]PNY37626.1 DinB family protein [Rhodopirellula baltica]